MERKRNFSLALVLEIHGDTLGPWGVTGWEEVELEGWPHQGGTESKSPDQSPIPCNGLPSGPFRLTPETLGRPSGAPPVRTKRPSKHLENS